MRKIVRMTQPGWETYTGPFGGATFVDGISEDLTDRQARFIANIITVVDVATGRNPSSSQELLDTRSNQAAIKKTLVEGETVPAATVKPRFTREELETIAGEKGINGLREVAPEGVKATSIARLIEAIIATQNGVALDESAETGQSPVSIPAVAPENKVGEVTSTA